MPEEDKWSKYQELVLSDLKRLDTYCQKIDDTTTNIQVEIAMLKAKAGIWGAGAGLVFGAIASAIMTFIVTKL